MRSSTLSIASLALVAQSLAAYVPSEPWSTLTPSQTLAGATTDYASTFAISIDPIPTTSSVSVKKRDNVTQIGDGQIQATTKTTTSTTAPVVTQIGDGQIQATTKTTTPAPQTTTTAPVVTQIGDGQIQATTKTTTPTVKTTTAPVVTQIGDGQIQATTKTTAPVVTQIGDGQIQATTQTTAPVVTQIGDGQIQATTKTTTAPVVTQIGDGQIQATTKTTAVATQIGDGQVQATTGTTDKKTPSTSTSSGSPASPSYTHPVSCKANNTLSMTLKGSILTDIKGRVGSIVANRQFQFDGPPPQAGALYAAGWGISSDGNLAIGNTTVFYQCLSGNFYNLYDEEIGDQCEPVYLKIVDLIDC